MYIYTLVNIVFHCRGISENSTGFTRLRFRKVISQEIRPDFLSYTLSSSCLVLNYSSFFLYLPPPHFVSQVKFIQVFSNRCGTPRKETRAVNSCRKNEKRTPGGSKHKMEMLRFLGNTSNYLSEQRNIEFRTCLHL